MTKRYLNDEELELLENRLKRKPTEIEEAIIFSLWSEHCSYKSSKIYLKKLPTKSDKVIIGPGENAGVIDIGDGYVAVFKMESHNHP
ncbi:MAG: phosphoribosylformylglycinamidine synthase II, partial [Desulfurella sp.]